MEKKHVEYIDKHKNAEFGSEMEKAFFLHDKDTKYLNHGSFGSTLKPAVEARMDWIFDIERNPWQFLELFHQYGIRRAATQLSKLIGCESEDIAFLPNATTCMSSVIRSLQLTPNDSIMINNFTYAAVKKIVHYVSTEKGSKIVYVDITSVLDDEDKFVELIENSLKPSTKYAVFDHIISETATIVPIKRLIQVCKKRGVTVIIDGAHAVGQVPIDLMDLAPGYYCSNAHKWLCSSRGCAFLYVAKEHQGKIKPPTISHGYPYGFLSEFLWTGTDDYTSYISLPVALYFFNSIGTKKIMERNHNLVIEAAKKCASAWGTKLLCNENVYGSMVTIELPKIEFLNDGVALRNYLFSHYKIVAPIVTVNKKFYVRISAQVFNSIEDYKPLAEAIKEIAHLKEKPWK